MVSSSKYSPGTALSSGIWEPRRRYVFGMEAPLFNQIRMNKLTTNTAATLAVQIAIIHASRFHNGTGGPINDSRQ
jgi:hypothetical protein